MLDDSPNVVNEDGSLEGDFLGKTAFPTFPRKVERSFPSKLGQMEFEHIRKEDEMSSSVGLVGPELEATLTEDDH